MEGISKKALTASLAALLLTVTIPALAQMQIGDNWHLNGGGMATFGYSGDYGDNIPSSHGLDFGLNGQVNGFYYNPNFINFTMTPYYNQSRADSDFQSLTGASGFSGTANLFTGSHFPGSVSYRDDYNSTGTFGLTGQPDFTTHGHGQGFGINWAALLPNWPTLSVGYSQGSGGGTVYGTSQETGSDTKLFNLRSSYAIEGFHLNGFFDHNNLHSTFPEFLSGETESVSDTHGHDWGFSGNHSLPLNGSFYANYSRSSASTDFIGGGSINDSYTTGTETAGANFHPTQKWTFSVSESYTDNLSGFLNQNLSTSGAVLTPINLGSGSDSMTFGGGAGYQFTHSLNGQVTVTHYQESFLGQSFSGTFASATMAYTKKLFNMFSFSGGIVDSASGHGDNAIGFIGNVNYFRRIKGWETSGNFSYAQNVQSLLITYTTSYYNYSARVRRRFGHGFAWTGAYVGSHSGLAQYAGEANSSTGYSTSFSNRRFTLTGNYSTSKGQSLLTSQGIVPITALPGIPESNLILYNADSYGGGLSATPLRHLTLSATWNRAFSNTIASTTPSSRNNTDIMNAQMQYHLRRIGLLAGYTKFTQGISAADLPPASSNSFFVGVSRWFDFF